ncbi:MAG: hypothetical protein JW976_13955 [Syntrophaceae bacterium]|nr:hypothetical protein [Syntrophaceae bacterium]
MSNMSTKIIGDFGESITAFLLDQEYNKEKKTILRVGTENLPYDLIIPYPIKNSPFTTPTLISVKTRGKWSDVIPPTREELKIQMKKHKALGYSFWLSFVKYKFNNHKINFHVYMLPTEKLSFKKDFKRVKRKSGYRNQIITANLKEKAVLKFNSDDQKI